jgi:hypothetical protein
MNNQDGRWVPGINEDSPPGRMGRRNRLDQA